jgi:glutamine synthetase
MKVLKTEFSGLFINDIFDRRVVNLKKAEERVNIVGVPTSIPISSPFDNGEQYTICDGFVDDKATVSSKLCARTLLKEAVCDLAKLGYGVKCGNELEWTMFDKVTGELAVGNVQSYSTIHYQNSNIQNFFSKLSDLKFLSVFPQAIHSESGKSMFECALSPSDPITVADATQLFRLSIRRLADMNGFKATFSPKPFVDAAGCGAHFHLSLHTLDADVDDDVQTTQKNKTVLFSYFLAGILHHMPTSMLLLCPNANSFKRLNGEFWTPLFASYGIDSRSEAVRLISSEENDDVKNARLEMRMAGSDVNPYLALLFCVKAGTYGIENKMELSDMPASRSIRLPRTLDDAVESFISIDSPARALYGDAFVEHYGSIRKHDASIPASRPSGWELDLF